MQVDVEHALPCTFIAVHRCPVSFVGNAFLNGNFFRRGKQAANDFLARLEADGTLNQLKERQFGHAWGVDQVDSQTFNRRMRQRLPDYEQMFRHNVATMVAGLTK